jgi:hypothetical protein
LEKAGELVFMRVGEGLNGFGKNWQKLKSGTDWHCGATLLQWTRKSSFLNSTANGTAG